MKASILFLIFSYIISLSICGLNAQTIQEDLWITNGSVRAIVEDNGIVYIGGNFTYVGPNTGHGAAIDTTTGNHDSSFPRVNGTIYVVIPDGSGGWYIGGDFTMVGGVARNNIAHINADKTVDAWNPDASNAVRALAISGSIIYTGGEFTSIGGQARNRIAAIDIFTGNATSWNPDANSRVLAIAISGSTVYAGGGFTRIGGQTRNRISAIDISSGNATSWNPDADSNVLALAISNSTIYAGGYFGSIGGQTRNNIAAIDMSNGNATSWNSDADYGVNTLAISDSIVYAGGNFSRVGGQLRNCIAAIEISTGNVTSWNPDMSNYVNTLAISGSTVYVGGAFTGIDGQTRNHIAAIDILTGNATAWNPGANGYVNNLAISGTTVYAGGDFISIGGQTRNYIAAIDTLTGNATAWNPNITGGYVEALAVSGPTVYAGGGFTIVDGQARNRIAAIDITTGNVSAWNPDANNTVRALEVQGSTLYAGGGFGNIGGQTRSRLASFDISSGNLTTWNPNVTGGDVYSFKLSGSTVFIGGSFNNVGGQTRNKLAAVDISLGEITSWNPDADAINIYALDISGSNVYVGGQNLYSIGGVTRNNIAAIDILTGLATEWNPDPNGIVYGIKTFGSNVYACGEFLSVGGQQRSRIAAIDTLTGIATDWNPDMDGWIDALEISGSTVYAGGDFNNVGGKFRPNFAGISLSSETSAAVLQFSSYSLDFSQTAIGENNDLPLTIYNAGNSELNISSKDINGPNGDEFSILQGGGASTIAAGDSEEVVIRFSPTSIGAKSADFIIESNAAGSPDTVNLVGIAGSDNNALSLDGYGDYVEIFDSPSLDLMNEITIEAWINPASLDSINPILTKWKTEGPSQGSWIFSTESDSLLKLYVSSDGSTKGAGVIAETKLPAGTYSHVAGTYSLSDNIIKVYQNGQKIGEQSGQGGLFVSSSKVLIGAIYYYLDESYFHGEIDEVRIWSKRRTLSQIRATISDTLGPEYYSSADSGLAAYWRFDKLEDLGINGDGVDDLRDLSINQNNGDIFGNITLVPSGAFADVIVPTTLTVEVDSLPAGNSDIGIQIIPPEGYNPQTHNLYYRRAGESDWQSVNLVLSGNNFQANIPSTYSTLRGVEYYIYLNDGQNEITYPQANPHSHPAIIQVHIDRLATQTNFEAQKHKMISIPLELSDAGIASLFFDDYGAYDNRNWRLQYWDGNQQDYLEYPELNADFKPGFSCWLITRSGLPFDIENGKSVRSDSAYTIALQPGWNQIGNPFAFSIAWNSIGNSSLVNQPVYWNGEDYEYGIATINPWEGYFVNNLQNDIVNLNIQPVENPSALEKKSSFSSLSTDEFIIQISAVDLHTDQSDEQNFMGMLKGSKNGLDVSDYLQAPAILEKTELSIIENDTLYAGNFKTVSAEGAYWDLQLSSFNKKSKVRLDLNPLNELPELFDMYLLDLDYNCPIVIGKNKELIEFREKEKRNLRLIVGKESFAKAHNKEISLTPLEFKLEQNFPNPFNPVTTISYTLAKNVHVKIEIFNILGQKVATLLDASQESGQHHIMWNGQNESGKIVSSGIYLYRLQAGNFIAITKMILLR